MFFVFYFNKKIMHQMAFQAKKFLLILLRPCYFKLSAIRCADVYKIIGLYAAWRDIPMYHSALHLFNLIWTQQLGLKDEFHLWMGSTFNPTGA